MATISIRRARPEDAETIVALIGELAEYEELAHQVRATAEDVLREGFGPKPSFECLIADSGGEAVGFALFFQSYSTFEGRAGLYLEDLYVRENARAAGVGRRLVEGLAAIAADRGYARLDLAALHWNPARKFYEKLGFRPLADWRSYRIEGEALHRLARRADSSRHG